MVKRITLIISISISLFNYLYGSDGVTLVKNGKSVSMIVIAENATPSAKKGAENLQVWLKKISGALVPIKNENLISKKRIPGIILVGDTKRTRNLGVISDEFDREEIIVRTFKDALVITGDDKLPDGRELDGTIFAVDAFVEEILGVRVLWPGELGEIVPHSTTIEIKDVNIRQKPVLVDRRMVNLSNSSVTHPKMDALGWDRKQYKYFQEVADNWLNFHRIGGSYNGSFGHAFSDYWDRFHEDHPDWFALQPDGTRDNSQPEHAKYNSQRLCISNQELIEHVAEDCIEKLEKNPTLDAVSISPNDGGNQTFCLCPSCEAWDAPGGDTVYMNSKQGIIPHVSLTDRFVKFYSKVAEIVAEKYPDRYIGAYAYHLYVDPPLKTKLHPNVVIGFVPAMRVYQNDVEREKMLDSWSRWSQSAQHLFLRPNFLMALQAIPAVYVHRLGEDMRFFADNKMLFARFDCNFHHWATNGLNYYVLAKLLWDPNEDVDNIVNDYCTVGFGHAAEEVHAYFNEIEKLTIAIAAERKRPDAYVIALHYTDENIAKLNGLLDEADKAAGNDDMVKKRIAFLRLGLEYAPIGRDYLIAKKEGRDGDKWQWRTYLEESARRTTWFQKLGPSWAIHAPWLIYWDK